jgi:hypothetical protein
MAAAWERVAAYSSKSVQATTEDAPTLDTEGVELTPCAGFHLFAEADVGQTFSGSGSVVGFMWDPICGWARAAELDASFVAADASNRRVFLGAFPVTAPRGRVAHACNAVGVSGGGVTLYYAMSDVYGRRI